MLIKIDSLEMCNFGIYRDKVFLDFRGKDIIGILAEYENNKYESNRSGKSLLGESIRYNLTGLTRAKREVNMIHEGEDFMYVKCIYSDENGKTYTVKRGRKHNGQGMLEVDWIEKTRDSQKAIEDIFGVNPKDFDYTNFFKQSDINGFMNLSPSEKSAYLTTLLNNDYWTKINQAVSEDIRDYKIKLKENEAVRKSKEKNLLEVDGLNAEIETNDLQCQQLESDLEILDADIDELEKEYSLLDKEIYSTEKQIEQLKKEIAREERNKKNNENLVKQLSNLELDLEDINQEILVIDSIEGLENITENYTNTLLKLENEEGLLKGIIEHGGVCPITKNACGEIDPDNEATDNCKENISRLKNQLSDLKKVKKEADKLQSLKDERSEITNKVNYIKGSIKSESNLDELKSDLDKLSTCTKDKERRNKLDQKINTLLDNRDGCCDELDKIKEETVKIKERIAISERCEEELIHHESINKKLRLRISDLSYLAMITSKSGIPSDEIDNAFSEIEDNTNNILAHTGLNLTASFASEKELTAWEPFCSCGLKFPKGFRGTKCTDCEAPRQKKRKNEISLKILEGGKEKDFSLDSGGGQAIISFCVRLALTMFKRSRSNSHFNVIFLDEVDSALDRTRWQAIIDIIVRVLTKQLGYAQIFMVSHKDEIKNSIPHIIKVIRYQDYSTASFI